MVVGAGQAGFQLARALRTNGYDGDIRLVGGEPVPPYQRPPLSKAFLAGEIDATDLLLASPASYSDDEIDYTCDRALGIDLSRSSVTLERGHGVDFEHLVLATGARCRKLPGHEPADGLLYLRSIADAEELRHRLRQSGEITIIGAGFLGLEVAAVCATIGTSVRVLETQTGLMRRNVSTCVAEVFYRRLLELGVQFDLGIKRLDVKQVANRVVGVETDRGFHAGDLVLACIGVLPNTELAAECGLSVNGGVLVDKSLTTNAPTVMAIGDCAAYPNPYFGGIARLESIQNAIDQADFAARRLTMGENVYRRLPWFWSEQAGYRLQIAGNAKSPEIVRQIVQGFPSDDTFSVFSFSDAALVAVESVNAPKDHMLARKLLAADIAVTVEDYEALRG